MTWNGTRPARLHAVVFAPRRPASIWLLASHFAGAGDGHPCMYSVCRSVGRNQGARDNKGRDIAADADRAYFAGWPGRWRYGSVDSLKNAGKGFDCRQEWQSGAIAFLQRNRLYKSVTYDFCDSCIAVRNVVLLRQSGQKCDTLVWRMDAELESGNPRRMERNDGVIHLHYSYGISPWLRWRHQAGFRPVRARTAHIRHVRHCQRSKGVKS